MRSPPCRQVPAGRNQHYPGSMEQATNLGLEIQGTAAGSYRTGYPAGGGNSPIPPQTTRRGDGHPPSLRQTRRYEPFRLIQGSRYDRGGFHGTPAREKERCVCKYREYFGKPRGICRQSWHTLSCPFTRWQGGCGKGGTSADAWCKGHLYPG